MSIRLLTEHNLEFLCLKGGCQAHLSLHLSKHHIVGNHMLRLICLQGLQSGMTPRDNNKLQRLVRKQVNITRKCLNHRSQTLTPPPPPHIQTHTQSKNFSGVEFILFITIFYKFSMKKSFVTSMTVVSYFLNSSNLSFFNTNCQPSRLPKLIFYQHNKQEVSPHPPAQEVHQERH